MKTMKLWRIAFMMLAAFSLASCSSDDDSNVYEAAELGGTWQKVYDEGVAGHRRQKPLANQLPHTEDTETSIGFYYSRNS